MTTMPPRCRYRTTLFWPLGPRDGSIDEDLRRSRWRSGPDLLRCPLADAEVAEPEGCFGTHSGPTCRAIGARNLPFSGEDDDSRRVAAHPDPPIPASAHMLPSRPPCRRQAMAQELFAMSVLRIRVLKEQLVRLRVCSARSRQARSKARSRRCISGLATISSLLA